MQQILPLAVALLIGIVGGAVLVNILIGSRLRAIMPEPGDTRNVLALSRTTDAPGALTSEVAQKQQEINELREKLTSSDTEVETFKKRCAELEEKASKVSSLETELSALQKRMEEQAGSEPGAPRLNDSQAESGAAPAVEALKKEVADLRAQAETLTAKTVEQQKSIDALEAEKIELTDKAAQSIKNHEKLNGKQADAATEIESLREQLAALREKAQASSERAAQQEKARQELEAEKAKMTAKLNELNLEFEVLKEKDWNSVEQTELLKKEIAALGKKLESANAAAQKQQKAYESLQAEKTELAEKYAQGVDEQVGLKARISELTELLDAERRQTTEKAQLLGKAREQLSMTLKVLGTEIAEQAEEKAEEKEVAVTR